MQIFVSLAKKLHNLLNFIVCTTKYKYRQQMFHLKMKRVWWR